MMKKAICAAVLAVAACILPGCMCGAEPSEIGDFTKYVRDIRELTIPEGTRIVALGEATHGNREFQQSKREVFEILSEKNDIRALVIEGDFGGCSIINDYIQGGDGDEREMTKLLGYRLYRTDDMLELIRWMRDHNASAADDHNASAADDHNASAADDHSASAADDHNASAADDHSASAADDHNASAADDHKVRLYGMDIQSSIFNVSFLKEFYAKAAPERAAEISGDLEDLFGTEEDGYDPSRADEIIAYTDALAEDLADNADAYAAATGRDRHFRACLAAEALKRYINYREKENFSHKYRDGSMKDLTDRILAFEEEEHGSELMIACHNGHMTKNQSSNFTFLGKYLYEELKDAYFAIGTDFYITSCNLPGKDGRMVKEFCSDDPLAYNMKDSELDKGLLVFSEVDEDSELYPYITESIPTGSLGEGYSPLMMLMKNQYQVYFAPEEMYDAMILYYETTPTEIWTD